MGEQRCLTPRSSGAPTAGHQARPGGTRYIFASPGLASCRCRPLSSNVRPHEMPILSAARIPQFQRQQTALSRSSRPRTARRCPRCAGSQLDRQLHGSDFSQGRLEAGRSAVTMTPYLSRIGACPCFAQRRVWGPCKAYFVFRSRCAVRLQKSVQQSLPRRFYRARMLQMQVKALQAFKLRQNVRPNPSLKRSANGVPPGPVCGMPHFPQPGPGVPPLAPA